MKRGGDGRNVRKHLQCFLRRVVEGASYLFEGRVLDLFKLSDEGFVRALWVEPELRAVGDGGDDYRLVEKAEVGGGDACDSVAEDFEACRDRFSFLGEEGHVVSERKLTVEVESEPADL